MDLSNHNNQANDYHVFVTDSVWLKELGLGTFTTGTLYDWWYQKDRQGNYINRKLVDGNPASQSPVVFFQKSASAHAYPWRFAGDNKGKYEYKEMIKYAASPPWKYEDNREPKDGRVHLPPYEIPHLADDFFNGNRYLLGSGAAGMNDPLQGAGAEVLEGLLKPQRFAPADPPHPHDVPNHMDMDKPEFGIGGGGVIGFTNIIAMNDWVRDVELRYPDKKDWTREALARYEYIEDIKTSKSGCLIIPAEVTFDVAPGQLFDDNGATVTGALKTESFTMKLYLYDKKTVRNTGKTAILTSTKHAGVPTDFTGRMGYSEDGEIEEADTDDPSAQVAGDIDLSLNPLTGKWQSGSKQILAKLSYNIPAAVWSATIEDLEGQDNAETLNTPEDPKHLVMGTGAAMPITMQNGNPMQWTPNYAQPKGCRTSGGLEDRSKATVVVHNPDPSRVWESGKIVILNEIDGVWMPMDFGSGVQDTVVPPSTTEGRWDFTYLATSLSGFFRGWATSSAHSVKITSTRAEKAFHVHYYEGDTDNWADPAGTVDSPHLFTKNILPFTAVHGYHQFTSFDFMDYNIGGTRGEKRSLGATVYGRDPLDRTHDDSAGTLTGPFFGCLFPNGYKGASDERNGPNDYVSDRPWHVACASVGVAATHPFFGEQGTDHLGNAVSISTTTTGIADPIAPPAPGAPPGGVGLKDYLRHAYRESPADDNGDLIPMFAGVVNGDYSVKHLPADIATNASPSGKYGRPITDLQGISIACHGSFVGAPLQDYLRKVYFSPDSAVRHHWLYKNKYWDGSDIKTVSTDPSLGTSSTLYEDGVTDSDGNITTGATDESAFDFQPIKANVVQFRPLKVEVYASFVDDSIRDLMLSRDLFYHHVRSKMNDGEMPASIVSRDRERGDLYGSAYGIGRNRLYREGLPDYQNADGVFPPPTNAAGHGLGFNVDFAASLFKINNNSSRFDAIESWSQLGDRWPHGAGTPSEAEPAGAVGVIGAVTTVSAASYIDFFTDQRFGMQPVLAADNKWWVSWGGAGLGYPDFQTTDLSVKVYHAWPREQTIYDPRFFAIHHFNHGTTADLTYPIDISQTVPTNTKREIWKLGVTYDTTALDHLVDTVETTVDIREPSYIESSDLVSAPVPPALPTVRPVTPPAFGGIFPYVLNSDIFKDAILPPAADYKPLLASGHWNVNPGRRGKLLPFHYRYKSVNLPYPSGTELELKSYAGVYFSGGLPQNETTGNWIDNPSTVTVVESGDIRSVNMVVQDLGHDYLVGDRFTVVGTDAILEVTKVSDKSAGSGNPLFPALPPTAYTYTNSIDELKITNPGTYFDYNKMLPSGDDETNPIGSNAQGGARVEPLNVASVNGKGFKAYFTKGTIVQLMATDDKPEIASEGIIYHQLSMPAHNTPNPRDEVEPRLQEGTQLTKVELDNPSSDGYYDVFLHFHNDISHTWMSSNDHANKQLNKDQFIDVTISPV